MSARIYYQYQTVCPQREKQIRQNFWQEISKTTGIEVEEFSTFDCDGWATLNIKDKGRISIYYNEYGINIRGIDHYPTSYACYFIDKNDNRTGYAADLVLSLEKDSIFSPWFTFQVNKLQDIRDQYDAIIASLGALPKNPELVDFKDSYGQRNVVKNPEKKYRLYTTMRKDFILFTSPLKQRVACDLYTRVN